ncbi:hypothetical protein ACFQY5_18760 [Paeniroseomonas aquatica]|uniref:Uncharacterized protein n=1 Tax=Paeniroseomonas aquatica TaxID=373043 RepID=A0ABT8AGM1_9PROT|nr:hypothetical protein [Paeniroseomonas aquatica]MDN3568957.1 hypothetical protein [Paeniroseomonas aquatica]
MNALSQMRWHRAAARLHALGARAFAEAVAEVAQTHPAGADLLAVFETYGSRLGADMIRAAGADRFPPRLLAVVVPSDSEDGA